MLREFEGLSRDRSCTPQRIPRFLDILMLSIPALIPEEDPANPGVKMRFSKSIDGPNSCLGFGGDATCSDAIRK